MLHDKTETRPIGPYHVTRQGRQYSLPLQCHNTRNVLHRRYAIFFPIKFRELMTYNMSTESLILKEAVDVSCSVDTF